MIKATSQLTEVQKQIKDKPTNLTANVYKEDPRRGSLHVVVSNKAQDFAKDVYEMSFTDFEYTSSYGVYSYMTPSEAWNEILLGNGSLVLLKSRLLITLQRAKY
jgi:enoyl-[acyl-carrier-protein] reductase (NADH)